MTFNLLIIDLIFSTHKLYHIRVEKFIKAEELKKKIEVMVTSHASKITYKREAMEVEELFNREWPYRFSTEDCFFIKGLDLSKIDSFLLRGVTLFSVYKTLIQLAFVNGLQTFPLLQIYLLTLIQLAFLFYLIYAVLLKKVFLN